MGSPFKMKGMSFGNSPLKDTEPHTGGHSHTDYTKAGFMGTPTYSEKGYTDNKIKRNKNRKAFKFTKAGKLLRSIFGGGGSRGGSTTKLGCGPGSCN